MQLQAINKSNNQAIYNAYSKDILINLPTIQLNLSNIGDIGYIGCNGNIGTIGHISHLSHFF